MKKAIIQFAFWDKKNAFNNNNVNLKIGDKIVVDSEFGEEIAEVIELKDEKFSEDERDVLNIIRLATEEDLTKVPGEEEKAEAMEYCKKIIQRLDLPMKLLDVYFSLNRGRINFAFYSTHRVDFRDLVKELSSHFKGVIRLTQVGSRDEARVSGDYGPCGRRLCCKRHIRNFSSISSEMAERQQVVHRGSDRVSGMCGKLMCCLAYEYEGYLDLYKKLPAIGAKVNVDGRRGEVIGHHVLKQSVDVLFKAKKKGENDVVAEVDINRDKKKK
jgi:cell fate regulator YaaT (PSP1 superfamily)